MILGMEKTSSDSIKRLRKYIIELESSKPKPSKEIDLGELAKLMNNVGFIGPINKPGTVRGFSHELLKSVPLLLNGSFTVHIVVKKRPTIRYHDFKKYVLPYIEIVLSQIEDQDLIQEEQQNV